MPSQSPFSDEGAQTVVACESRPPCCQRPKSEIRINFRHTPWRTSDLNGQEKTYGSGVDCGSEVLLGESPAKMKRISEPPHQALGAPHSASIVRDDRDTPLSHWSETAPAQQVALPNKEQKHFSKWMNRQISGKSDPRIAPPRGRIFSFRPTGLMSKYFHKFLASLAGSKSSWRAEKWPLINLQIFELRGSILRVARRARSQVI